jgi:hypothetical protein
MLTRDEARRIAANIAAEAVLTRVMLFGVGHGFTPMSLGQFLRERASQEMTR